MKLIYHLLAEVLDWKEGASNIYLRFPKEAKYEIQESILTKTGIKLDFPDSSGHGGTTTTGNVARRVLFQENIRKIILEHITPGFREDTGILVQNLAIIQRIVTSSRKVKVDDFRNFCYDTYRFLLEEFPWASITPTVHKVMTHSWEIIQTNDECNLESLSEEGLESCDKVLRMLRLSDSRKITQQAIMWLSSDPIINKVRKKSMCYCRHFSKHGHFTRYCKFHNSLFGP